MGDLHSRACVSLAETLRSNVVFDSELNVLLDYNHLQILKPRKYSEAPTGFEPMTSAIPVRRSTDWAMKPRRKQVRCEFNLYLFYHRYMPADVSVKEPSKGSVGFACRNHRKESSKGLYSRRHEHEATEHFNQTAASDSSTCTIMAGLTLNSLLFSYSSCQFWLSGSKEQVIKIEIFALWKILLIA